MASISMEGVVNPYSGCYIIINNNSGGINNDVSEFIKKFNLLDTNSVDVDSETGIDVKISQSKDNILEKTDNGLYVSMQWEDVN